MSSSPDRELPELIGNVPTGPVVLPAAVRTVAAGRATRPVWRNELGGLTVEIAGLGFVKWSPPGGPDLAAEAERLRWVALAGAPDVVVPRVLDQGIDDDGSWLLTAALPGRNAVDPRWLADPGPAVRAIGVGLRTLHDRLPVAGCPFSWSTAERVASAVARAGELDPTTWHPVHGHLTLDEALAALADPPPPNPVVCHGDACAPNTLVGDDGRPAGHVDLGALGVGDRWADLAVATWSTVWNHGPGWEDTLLAAYGVDPDPVRTAYYRLLWDLGD